MSTFLIIFLLTQFAFPKKIDTEVCKASIDARHSINYGFFDIGNKKVNLNCETKKICVSSDKNCDASLFDPSFTNPIIKNKVGRSDPYEIVLDTFAEALYDCHNVLREGKKNFLPSEWNEQNYCLICSRIALDDTTRSEVQEIQYTDLYRLMERKRTPENLNYLQYVYDINTASEMEQLIRDGSTVVNEELGSGTVKIDDFKLNLTGKEGHAIIAGAVTRGTWGTWSSSVLAGSAVTLGIIFAIPTGGSSLLIASGVAGAVTLGTATFGTILLGSFPDGNQYIKPLPIQYDIETLKNLKCNSFEFAP